jgi:hypothetical protein
MGTIEIHEPEPEVKEVKPPSRLQGAVLPKSDLAGRSLRRGRCSPTAS